MEQTQAERDERREATQRAAAIRMLVRYDPEGIAAMIEQADTVEALIKAMGQLAHLVAALEVIVRTGKTES